MLKKFLLAAAALVLLLGVAVFIWARSVFAQDTVRSALAAQLSQALGQPVSIEGINASVYPRVTVTLTGVRIGEPARAEIQTLNVGTALGALFSRRIEQASLLLENARVDLPLPLPGLAASEGHGDSTSPVQLVSIEDVTLRNVEIVSGGRTLRGDVEIGPRDGGYEIRRLVLSADDMSLEATGFISDPTGPVGELVVNAGALNFDQLLAFVADFQSGAGLAPTSPTSSGEPRSPPTAKAAAPGMNVAIALKAERATIGDLALIAVSGQARVLPGEVTLAPVAFGVFDGRYEGSLALTVDEVPAFHLTATLAGIDVGAATAFAGSPDTISGRLSGRIDLKGRGVEAGSVARTTAGTVRVDVADGIVRTWGWSARSLLPRPTAPTPVRRPAAGRLMNPSPAWAQR